MLFTLVFTVYASLSYLEICILSIVKKRIKSKSTNLYKRVNFILYVFRMEYTLVFGTQVDASPRIIFWSLVESNWIDYQASNLFMVIVLQPYVSGSVSSRYFIIHKLYKQISFIDFIFFKHQLLLLYLNLSLAFFIYIFSLEGFDGT